MTPRAWRRYARRRTRWLRRSRRRGGYLARTIPAGHRYVGDGRDALRIGEAFREGNPRLARAIIWENLRAEND